MRKARLVQAGGLALVMVAAGVAPPLASSQSLLNPPVILAPADLALLTDTDERDDLRCKLTTVRPEVGFDLQFHAGYVATVPLSELAGTGNELRVLMRIRPLARPETEYYLAQRFSVPPMAPDLRGEAGLPGGFAVGPGRYQVDWIMRDRSERACSAHWELEAKQADWLKDEEPAIAPDTIEESPRNPFDQSPPVERASEDRLLHAKLLVNFSPSDAGETTLKDWDMQAIVSILRSVEREPQMGRFSLVAFSMRQERALFRQDDTPSIDFPALGKAVSGTSYRTIDYQRLIDPLSETRFLAGLLSENRDEGGRPVDAVIIIGPKAMLDGKISEEILRQGGQPRCPVFYLNYNANPRRNPWRDGIGAALRVYRGLEYAITAPRDLAEALSDMMVRLTDRQWRESFLASSRPGP